uniref:Uncharacterized protein n=1 Tax=viral metagenome TaxID=1070528 RepID=A0A6M3JEA5_9ZZZZ
MLPGPDESCKDTWSTDECNNWGEEVKGNVATAKNNQACEMVFGMVEKRLLSR